MLSHLRNHTQSRAPPPPLLPSPPTSWRPPSPAPARTAAASSRNSFYIYLSIFISNIFPGTDTSGWCSSTAALQTIQWQLAASLSTCTQPAAAHCPLLTHMFSPLHYLLTLHCIVFGEVMVILWSILTLKTRRKETHQIQLRVCSFFRYFSLIILADQNFQDLEHRSIIPCFLFMRGNCSLSSWHFVKWGKLRQWRALKFPIEHGHHNSKLWRWCTKTALPPVRCLLLLSVSRCN